MRPGTKWLIIGTVVGGGTLLLFAGRKKALAATSEEPSGVVTDEEQAQVEIPEEGQAGIDVTPQPEEELPEEQLPEEELPEEEPAPEFGPPAPDFGPPATPAVDPALLAQFRAAVTAATLQRDCERLDDLLNKAVELEAEGAISSVEVQAIDAALKACLEAEQTGGELPPAETSPGLPSAPPAGIPQQVLDFRADVIAATAARDCAALEELADLGAELAANELISNAEAAAVEVNAKSCRAAESIINVPPQTGIEVGEEEEEPEEVEPEPQFDIPDDTALLVQQLLDEERGPDWKRESDEVADWQASRGLTADGRLGPGTARRMAEEIGTLPIVRFWPASTGTNPQKAIKDFRLKLNSIADTKPEPHASQLRASALREKGQSFGPPTGAPDVPIANPVELDVVV